MSSPGDVTDNYVALMRERGWTWGDLADQFERDATDGRALDGGANARRMAAWARSNAQAAAERRAAHEDPDRDDPPAPDLAIPEGPRRQVVPARTPRRG